MEVLPDRLCNFRKNIGKNNVATPTFKIQHSKIKPYRGYSLKVRKTGLKEGIVAGASAVAAGSMFVFQGKHRAVLISYPLSEDLKALGI